MSFHVIRDDIVHVKADAIVNTANYQPKYASGTDAAVYTAAGAEKLLEERRKIGFLNPGEAAYTPAFKLNAKYIIHVSCPAWNDGNHGEEKVLVSCYRNALELAEKLGCTSAAFPLLASGNFAFPKEKALGIALHELQTYAMKHDMRIDLVVFDEESYALAGRIFDDIEAYVDDHYVKNAEDVYYPQQRRFVRNTQNRTSFAKKEETFQEKMLSYLNASGMKNSEFYNSIQISKQMFSKIQSSRNYQPEKRTALAMCIALKLDLDETNDLLQRAGYAFSPASKADMIIKGFIVNHHYCFQEIDTYLANEHLPLLLKY